MKQKFIHVFFSTVLFFGLVLLNPANSQAAMSTCNPSGEDPNFDYIGSAPADEYDDPNAVISFTLGELAPNSSYTIFIATSGCGVGVGSGGPSPNCPSVAATSASSNAAREATFTLAAGAAFPENLGTSYSMWLVGPGADEDGCKLHTYDLVNSVVCSADNIIVSQTRDTGEDGGEQTCVYQEGLAGSCLNSTDPVRIGLTGLRKQGSLYNGEIQINPSWRSQIVTTSSNGSTPTYLEPNQNSGLPAGSHSISVEPPGNLNIDACSKSIQVSVDCQALCITEDEIGEAETLGPDKFSLCEQINDPTAQQKCLQCSGGENGTEGIWTAVGCINREPEVILGRMIRLGISMGGGIALLMILSAGFTLTISQGNAQKTAQAKEMITAAITGLLFIIFSVTILQFIGFSILKIPGFGG